MHLTISKVLYYNYKKECIKGQIEVSFYHSERIEESFL